MFVTWKGDHPPRHVHVYQDSTLIVKWNLDDQRVMNGQASQKLLKIIRELEREGKL